MKVIVGKWIGIVDKASKDGIIIRVACTDKTTVFESESGQGDGNENEQLALRFSSKGIEGAFAEEGDVNREDIEWTVIRGIWDVVFLQDSDEHCNVYVKNSLGFEVGRKVKRTTDRIPGLPTMQITITPKMARK